MSDTPRTDAAVREVDVAFVGHWGLASEPQEFVPPEFARELERENAELRENKERLERVILRYAHTEENLASTIRGLEFELERAERKIDGMLAELATAGGEEIRQTRAENHRVCEEAKELRHELISTERELEKLKQETERLQATLWGTEFELEKAKSDLDWLNTNCVSADPIMGRSIYRWNIEYDEPDLRAFIQNARRTAQP